MTIATTRARASAKARAATIRRLPPSRIGPLARALLVAEVVLAYARARRELRRASIELVIEALRGDASVSDPVGGAQALSEARRLGRIVGRTLELVPGDTRCLARSLVLTRLLARRGIASKLAIGARADPEFLAHAWVECDGEPVLPPGDGSFARLVEL